MLGEVPPGEIHKCSQCDRSFKQERALRIHKYLMHANPRRRSKTNTAKVSEGQGTSEKISSKPRNTRIITFLHVFVFVVRQVHIGKSHWKTLKTDSVFTMCAVVAISTDITTAMLC